MHYPSAFDKCAGVLLRAPSLCCARAIVVCHLTEHAGRVADQLVRRAKQSFRVPSSWCGCREDAESGQTTKTIIFCTFTKALDLMQKRLDEAGARWVRLDGKMRLSQRTEATREFALNPEVGA